VRDSFAFVGYSGTFGIRSLRALNVADPINPTLVAQESCYNWPEDCVLRDSFLYIVEAYQFQVFNVARPREPVLTGSCGLSSYATDLRLVDTLAFMSGLPLTVVSVAQPGNPRILSTWSRGVAGLDVVDTVLYAVGQNAQFWAVSVANPSSPRTLDSLHLPSYDGEDVVVVGSIAYVGERVIRVVDVSDPANLRLRAAVSTPSTWTPRLVYAAPYVYACFGEGGVAIYETTHVAFAEPKMVAAEQARKGASVVRGVLNLGVGSRQNTAYRAELLDISGRKVLDLKPGANDVRALAPGVYFVREAQAQAQAQAVRKVVKLK
jgi:hypothetical protein